MPPMKKRLFWALPILYIALTLACWLHTPNAESLSERRKLAQIPKLTWSGIQSGSFASNFESCTQDQFPLRETFRRGKALFSTKLLGRRDNNRIYESGEGFLAKLEYPMNEASVDYAASRFRTVYDRYLAGSNRVYVSLIPDKTAYLDGIPKLDHTAFAERLRKQTPFANFIDLSDTLTLNSFYKTDTHWRQETLGKTAEALAAAMGKHLSMEYETKLGTADFLGVYAGQSALPVAGEPLYYLWNDAFNGLEIQDRENNRTIGVYDLSALNGRDPYEMYLSGSLSLITVKNPNASSTDKLIIFRDSFGSSIAPYFFESYDEVTLVDIRYLPVERLGKFLDFADSDVLFLYSTLVLNNSETLK